MLQTEFELILSLIALKNNTTVEEVRHEMQIAMEAGFSNPDPNIQKKWAAIPRKGAMPTLEEFVSYIAEHLQ